MKSSKLVSTIVTVALAATMFAPFANAADAGVTAGTSGANETVRVRTGNLGSSGQDGVTVGGKATVPTAAQFCALIDSRMRLTAEQVDGMRSKIDGDRAKRDALLRDRQLSRDANLKTTRDTQDVRVDGIVAMLSGRATTDAQKAAVVSFQANSKIALDTRRAAVEQANADFKAGMDKVSADHATRIDAAVTAMQAAIQAALDKAKSDCAAGVASADARATMLKTIEAARAKFKTDTAGIDKVGTSAKALASVHRVALDKAFAAFKVAMEADRKALKAAFPDEKKDNAKKPSGMINANVSGSATAAN